MTIGAANIALSYFVQYLFPLSVSRAISDIKLFVAAMIEIEHNRVRFSTVDAGMFFQVLDDPFYPLRYLTIVPLTSLL